MKSVAVIMTVFNRIEKTLLCLESLFNATPVVGLSFKVFITDDGSSDGTKQKIFERFSDQNIEILEGNGSLYWNGGMNFSWRHAIAEGGFDGYLWLNNDSIVFANLWTELVEADAFSKSKFHKGGIYIGSTLDNKSKKFTYGGFDFVNKWTLLDQFKIPNGSFQNCEAGHGNITYVSSNVVESEGVFYDKYFHGGGDHDYTYLAFKHGFPVFILRDYVGACENDHTQENGSDFKELSLRERFKYLYSPLGYNLHNTLLFQRRCFPHRYLPVLIMGYAKAIFPTPFFAIYKWLRKF
ncbi:glycosyltransferase family 2 protein [Sphingobacterium hotanense]|uniref:glycosyltransferase family 2 protein n=1 Tax=Sphingobacterium hotanense TaxID=649196 RepID=UPI0021A8D7C6|nr:glycosyltransferase family 2 protein [Sphingobacterium hotanense]MCT1526187.1 glycosyltransferase family 2 protein [Sphingobacterium hotanense]